MNVSDITYKVKDKEHEIVVDCLEILANLGNYEGGAVAAYNAIAKKHNINISYDEMYYAGE